MYKISIDLLNEIKKKQILKSNNKIVALSEKTGSRPGKLIKENQIVAI